MPSKNKLIRIYGVGDPSEATDANVALRMVHMLEDLGIFNDPEDAFMSTAYKIAMALEVKSAGDKDEIQVYMEGLV